MKKILLLFIGTILCFFAFQTNALVCGTSSSPSIFLLGLKHNTVGVFKVIEVQENGSFRDSFVVKPVSSLKGILWKDKIILYPGKGRRLGSTIESQGLFKVGEIVPIASRARIRGNELHVNGS